MDINAYGQTTDYAVYLDGGTNTGVATVELPKFEFVTETLSGAGLGGEVESAVVGLVKPTSVKFSFNKMTSHFIKLSAPKMHHLDLRISTQGLDTSAGTFTNTPEKVTLRTLPKSINPGKLDTGKKRDSELEYEVVYVKYSINGEDVLEFDKFNYKFVVDGTDYMADIRRNIGMEG